MTKGKEKERRRMKTNCYNYMIKGREGKKENENYLLQLHDQGKGKGKKENENYLLQLHDQGKGRKEGE